MDVEELQEYIEQNSGIKQAFMDKTLEFLNQVNKAKAPANRQNKEMIQHQADRQYDTFVQQIYDKILAGTPLHSSDSAERWATVIEEAEILDNIEESIVDSDYDE